MTMDLENQAGIARVTCGWKKPELSLDAVRPYWRDAHSPAIARRAGLFEYRHYPLDPIRTNFFAPLAGIEYGAPPNRQLMWLSDVRYHDEAGMEAFGASPPPAEKAQILADIELIVDQSTTYKVIGENGRTFLDLTGDWAPQGPSILPNFGIFFRQRGDEASFRACLRTLARRWAKTTGIVRVRMNLFEVPDMEAERKAGYPVKTHPQPLQYQAWIDLIVKHDRIGQQLLSGKDDSNLAAHVSTIHVYPAPAVYTFNQNGRPTLSGLRGYPAYAAIKSLDAVHQEDAGLLTWMYGPVAAGGTSA